MLVWITLPDMSEKLVKFAEIIAMKPYTILYFYPEDNTSWCTLEAKEFTWLLPAFTRNSVQIVWVSKDGHRSHCWFIEKHGLDIPLISDPEWILHNQFGTVGEKSMYGKKYMGTIRSTVLLDSHGTIVHQRSNVEAPWHAQIVLDYVSEYLN